MITEDNSELCLISWHFYLKTHVIFVTLGHDWGRATPLLKRLMSMNHETT